MKEHPALALRDARRAADTRASALAQNGRRVVRTLGTRLPLPLLRAGGVHPVALAMGKCVERKLPAVELDEVGRRMLSAVISARPGQPLLLATHDASGARLFAILRELMRCEAIPARPLHGLDLLRPLDGRLVRYNLDRLTSLADWLVSLGASPIDPASLAQALALDARSSGLVEQLDAWRMCPDSRVAGSEMREARLAGGVLDPDKHSALLQRWLDEVAFAPVLEGERLFVAGTSQVPDGLFDILEALGRQVVADDAALDDEPVAPPSADPGPWTVLASRPVQTDAIAPADRARWSVERARRAGARRLVHVRRDADEAQAWLRPFLEAECRRAGLDFLALDLDGTGSMEDAVRRVFSDPSLRRARASANATGVIVESRPGSSGEREAPYSQRSRKSLQAVADFGRYQRDWFQAVRQRAASGEPFAVINADAPQEILRALDIPFVVNQWWASIVAAKQQSGRYLGLLRRHGYPTDAEPYSAQGLAAALDDQPDAAPWGGLPRPQWLMAFSGTPATRGIFSAWSRRSGAELCLFERTVDTRVDLPLEWWSRLPHEWDELLERPRLDVVEGAFASTIDRLQRATGRRFDEARFAEVMHLVNEQEHYYRLTRDLIAACPNAPVGIVDTMPATMVPQWHRGTPWGRDAAKALYEEVRQRAQDGGVACPGERLRLMWVGRGLWSDMGFYQRWEESHGAVFVWSMYLALAADGYLRFWREDQSPLRALAARFVTMGDELRMPTWAGAWHLREARTHAVDAAVAIDDADPLVLSTLEAAGIPVLRLTLDNFAGGSAVRDEAGRRVEAFLDGLGGARRR